MNEQNQNDHSTRNMVLGGIGLNQGYDRVLGKKTMYHGTNMDNWNKIKHEGLRADRGGINGASEAYKNISDVKQGEKYINDSKGYVHFTPRKFTARQYANVASGNLDYDKMTPMDMLKGSTRVGEGGKVIKMKVNYDNYKKSKIDSGTEPIEWFNRKEQAMMKHLHGSKTKMDVTPEEIRGSSATLASKLKNTAKNLPGYIKNNPLRFGAGAALTGGGAYLLGKGIKDKLKHEEKVAEVVDYLLEK